jgi:hypothetical protein
MARPARPRDIRPAPRAGVPGRDRPRGTAPELAHVAIVGAIALLCVAVSLLEFVRTEPGNVDDGFILMVYVRHLIQNGVIAWNVGEPAVDGCTSMLDLLVKSAAVLVTGGDILWWTLVVTAVLHCLAPLVAIAIVLRLPSAEPKLRLAAAAAAGLILATMESSAYAASFLLEMPLYLCCALGLAGLIVLTPRLTVARSAALIAAAWLVVLARPEGLVLATLLLGGALWLERGAQPARRLGAVFGVFVLGVALYELWHFLTFGAWAPNAYYAKTSAVRANEVRDGAGYVLTFLSTPGGWVQLGPALLAPLAILGAGWSSPRARAHYALVSLAALALLGVTVYSGGDCYPGGRLLAPAIALGVLAVALGIVHARRWLRTALLIVAGGVLLSQCVRVAIPRPMEWGTHVQLATTGLRACETSFAGALRQALPSGTVAQTDFQRLKFWADPIRVVDLEGLSDRAIAHERVSEPVKLGKFSPTIVQRLKPEVWIPGHRFRTSESRVGATPHPLLTDAETQMRNLGYDERREVAAGSVATELAGLYLPASIKVCGIYYNLLVRKDVAARFSAVGFAVEGR